MTIKPLLVEILETALNRYLLMDEDAVLWLSPLTGKVIAVHFTPVAETVWFCPTETQIQLLEHFEGAVDATISGSLVAIGLIGINAPVAGNAPEITGDEEVGKAFLDLFRQIDVDLEEQLSRVTGDVLAHKIGHFFRTGRDWTRQALKTFRLNSEEFLQEETRDLPAIAEAEIFFTQVKDVQMQADALQRRIDALTASSVAKS